MRSENVILYPAVVEQSTRFASRFISLISSDFHAVSQGRIVHGISSIGRKRDISEARIKKQYTISVGGISNRRSKNLKRFSTIKCYSMSR